MKIKNTEYSIYLQLRQYIEYQYPDTIFHFDFGSGCRLPIGLAKKQKAINKKGFPDLFIAERNVKDVGLSGGLFIEIKKENEKLLKKNGDFVNEHIAEQYFVLSQLNKRYYTALFAVGFNECKEIIDWYLGNKLECKAIDKEYNNFLK